MSERIDLFWAKRKARQDLETKIERQLSIIDYVHQTFRNSPFRLSPSEFSGKVWQWVTVKNNLDVLQGFPAQGVNARITVDAASWPRLEDIAALLAEWHHLDAEYRDAWEKLTGDEKEQLESHAPERRKPPADLSTQFAARRANVVRTAFGIVQAHYRPLC